MTVLLKASMMRDRLNQLIQIGQFSMKQKVTFLRVKGMSQC